MSPEQFVEKLGKRLDRRNLMMKMGFGVTSGVAALLGVSRASALYGYYCCTLCLPNSGGCGTYACVWCWTCFYSPYNYTCCEYHTDTSYCGSGCGNVGCSHGYRQPYAPVS